MKSENSPILINCDWILWRHMILGHKVHPITVILINLRPISLCISQYN